MVKLNYRVIWEGDVLITEQFCQDRLMEQADYLIDLVNKRIRGEISEDRYQELYDSAAYQANKFETYLTKLKLIYP